MRYLRIIATLLTVCCWFSQLEASPVAFFPLLDLTRDANGINIELTKRLRQELLARDQELVAEDEIMAFLVRHHIRTLGKLTSYQSALVNKELGADLLLQGTILQLDSSDTPAIGIHLELSGTSNPRIAWSRIAHLNHADQISFLGLEDPENLDDLLEPFFPVLLDNLPKETEHAAEAIDRLNIAWIDISPPYVRPKEFVFCKIQLHEPLTENQQNQPDLAVTVGSKTYPLILDKAGNYLVTSWAAAEQSGEHPIFLNIQGETGVVQKRGLGVYSVDERPPGVRLTFIGTKLGGETLFGDTLKILPRLIEPEPINRWQILVMDEEDEIIVNMGGAGKIPRSLTWGGMTSLGTLAAPGRYLISFRVWDRADRESSAEAEVHFLPDPPDFFIEVVQEDNRVIVDLDNLTDTPLNYWWAKCYKGDGTLLELVEGSILPTSIELKVERGPDTSVQCLFMARDILGNQSQRNIANIFEISELDEGDEEASRETDWVEEF